MLTLHAGAPQARARAMHSHCPAAVRQGHCSAVLVSELTGCSKAEQLLHVTPWEGDQHDTCAPPRTRDPAPCVISRTASPWSSVTRSGPKAPVHCLGPPMNSGCTTANKRVSQLGHLPSRVQGAQGYSHNTQLTGLDNSAFKLALGDVRTWCWRPNMHSALGRLPSTSKD